MLRFRIVGFLALLLLSPAISCAELKLPAMFSDSMVLQRDQPIKIWGWATSGSYVSVSLGDQNKTAKADEGGRWELMLDALSAGGPHQLMIEGDGEKFVAKDVLVGEVWLCSGQSNIAMTVSRSKNAAKEEAAAKYPQIRMFKVDSGHSLEPQQTCTGKWTVCSPETVGGFTATGYFFWATAASGT